MCFIKYVSEFTMTEYNFLSKNLHETYILH